MTTLTDGEALLRAIIDNPADDDRRLVYADWLEDDGRSRRAQWVRLAVRLPHCSFVELTRDDPFVLLGIQPGEARPLDGWDDDGRPKTVTRTWMWGESEEMGLIVHDLGRGMDYRCERGFVERVRCPLAAWLAHGPALAKAHPLTALTLTDRGPYRAREDAFGWFGDGEGADAGEAHLPADLFRELGGPTPGAAVTRWFPTREAAYFALVLWARGPARGHLTRW